MIDQALFIMRGLAIASSLLYVLRWSTNRPHQARIIWSLACVTLVIHVLCAFQFAHHWSHRHAYEHTAARTAELTGVKWGGGLYLNYLFVVLWMADVSWWWMNASSYRSRPPVIGGGFQLFMAFMFVNAVVVFGSGPMRWIFPVVAVMVFAYRHYARPSG